MSKWDSWDESRARIRPNKKGSRPRTKDAPSHLDAELGRVVQVDRGRYTVSMLDDSRPVTAMRGKAMRRSAEGRTPVVAGDVVGLVGDTSGNEGSLARLVRIEERSSLLRRSADDTDDAERVIVANADQLLIVVAAADPEPRTGFIDRALVAAFEAGIRPVLLVTKGDLAESASDPAGLVSHYGGLDLEIVVSARSGADEAEGDGLDPASVASLRELLSGHVTALIGHSGVGKSTMVNELTGADRATGGVNAVTGRGRHTSSSAVALTLGSTGLVIDTPGVRSFGLAHVDPDDVLSAFEDLVEGSVDCEPGCTHESPAGGCALDAYVEQGGAGEHGPARLASLRGLLSSLAGAEEGPAEKRLGA
ncbi:ribosome small subunit-dependent GTPase A [Nesterenkonia sp. NBAIMH1]|uniref:ribosome small subunit-dependent GTPase A n=1 Tax=Nesterenkonia sp. NBAIMH1 TaxID=2600320 RepID=UPI0011B74757|nr:ribosome small subunit-dependent GTPase A [Nesterenkonia sp. NBAIMH1]